jgi:hypothetical protein
MTLDVNRTIYNITNTPYACMVWRVVEMSPHNTAETCLGASYYTMAVDDTYLHITYHMFSTSKEMFDYVTTSVEEDNHLAEDLDGMFHGVEECESQPVVITTEDAVPGTVDAVCKLVVWDPEPVSVEAAMPPDHFDAIKNRYAGVSRIFVHIGEGSEHIRKYVLVVEDDKMFAGWSVRMVTIHEGNALQHNALFGYMSAKTAIAVAQALSVV